MATGLADCGSEVTVLAVNTRKHYYPADRIPGIITERILFRSALADTRIKPFRLLLNLLFSKYPYNAERFISRRIISELKQLLDEQDFDVVQLEGPYLFYCLPVVRKRSGALISLRAHNIEHELWIRNAMNSHNWILRHYFMLMAARLKNLETALLNDIDALVPISGRDASVFAASGIRCPVHTTTFGLEADKYQVAGPGADFSLCFLGALDWRPNAEGLDWFIGHIWPLVKAAVPGIRFNIAGRNADRYYRRKIADPDILIMGETADARQFMSRYPVMIVPLRAGSGIRVKILEGMAMGMVIVTTSIGLEGIDARHGQEVMVADDPSAFVSSITRLAGDPDLLHSIGSRARQYVLENFDNLALCQGLLAFYKELLRWSGKSSSG
jgi:glycosyltransferase involved in cell wall biosynthesis